MFQVVGLGAPSSHPSKPVLQNAKLKCSNELGNLLKPSLETVQSMMVQSRTLDSFVRELDAIVRRLILVPGAAEAAGLADLDLDLVSIGGTSTSNENANASAKEIDANSKLFGHVAEELAHLGWSRVTNVDDSFRNLDLLCKDETGRDHTVQVLLPIDYPDSPPKCLLNVPVLDKAVDNGQQSDAKHNVQRSFQPVWSPESCNLSSVLSQCEARLAHFVNFWAEMDDFDTNTWVLEPARPSRSDVVRRIALRKHCSVEIALKPESPRDVCTCSFIGPESITGPLRDTFHSGQRNWDTSVPVRANLERILGQEFPSPDTSSKSDFSIECGVCYTYRIMPGKDAGGKGGDMAGALLPDTSCESCGQHFHTQCIGEWLQALPSSRRSFSVIFGNCPYCTAPLSVNLS